jgi:hypothetical protein
MALVLKRFGQDVDITNPQALKTIHYLVHADSVTGLEIRTPVPKETIDSLASQLYGKDKAAAPAPASARFPPAEVDEPPEPEAFDDPDEQEPTEEAGPPLPETDDPDLQDVDPREFEPDPFDQPQHSTSFGGPQPSTPPARAAQPPRPQTAPRPAFQYQPTAPAHAGNADEHGVPSL